MATLRSEARNFHHHATRGVCLAAIASLLALGAACAGSDEVGPAIEDDGANTGAKPSEGAGGDLGGGPGPQSSSSSATTGTGGTQEAPPEGGGGAAPTDCCTASDMPGCSADATLEQCVCDLDSYCCDTAWDDLCIKQGDEQCAGTCGTAPPPPPDGGSCDTGSCEQCILQDCGLDCLLDGSCGDAVHLSIFTCLVFTCGEECWGWEPPSGGGTGSGCGGTGSGAGDCCSANGSAGCNDGSIEACVCNVDDYCCTNEWDSICAQIADDDCDACGPSPGDCCATSTTGGCSDDASVEQCVCAQDSYCCNTAWDTQCTQEVESYGCNTCP